MDPRVLHHGCANKGVSMSVPPLPMGEIQVCKSRCHGGARRNHGVKRVNDRDDPCPQRDSRTPQAPRITLSIVARVVVQNEIAHVVKAGKKTDDRPPLSRVLLHKVGLLFRQLGGLLQNGIENADLADVVHHVRGLSESSVLPRSASLNPRMPFPSPAAAPSSPSSGLSPSASTRIRSASRGRANYTDTNV